MTRIDFYQLASRSADAREHFACRLAEKAVKAGTKVLIATQNEAMSTAMDERLWRFTPESFVPHTANTNSAIERINSLVIISHHDEEHNQHDLLINLRSSLPAYFSHFARLAEIIIDEPSVLSASREHWQFCKSRGYPMNHHKIAKV